jgi:hypothetical protein
MKYQTVSASGFWNDTKEPFFDMSVALGSWDEVEDAEDEQIFFYLDGQMPIGDHGDFTITEIEGKA